MPKQLSLFGPALARADRDQALDRLELYRRAYVAQARAAARQEIKTKGYVTADDLHRI